MYNVRLLIHSNIYCNFSLSTSCSAKPFCIAKLVLWNITFKDICDTILLCMIFLMFDHFVWSSFEGYPSHSKISNPSPTSGETPIKFTQTCFPPTHSCTRTSVGRSVDLAFCALVKKFTCAFLLTELLHAYKYQKAHLWLGHACIWSM
jgi:hypothetical protein